MKVKILIMLATIFALLTIKGITVSATESICGYTVEKGKNPTFQQVNCMLTTLAKEYVVPPEIVKAVATQEKGNWKQFDENGETIISEDGGIGIMQITSYPPEQKDRLKYDAIFNIEQGVKRLASNFYSRTDIPKINNHSPEKLESWYFAVMAYNGIKPVNSPLTKCSKTDISRNKNAYQEEVFNKLEGVYEISTKIDLLSFDPEEFQYSCTSSENITFKNLQYELVSLTNSKELYTNENDYVEATVNTRLQNLPSTGNVVKDIQENSVLTVRGLLEYDINSVANRFNWVPVKAGSQQGYIASKYINRIGTRIAGKDRFETAVQISKKGWDSTETVLLATAYNFPDALSGGPLAYKLDAPILLTQNNELNEKTMNEIVRLGAKKVIVLGGSGAINEKVANKLRNLNLQVERISGKDRYETSVAIAKKLGGNPKKAIIAYGQNFPDALAIAPYAARHGYPILLTDGQTISTSVKQSLTGINETIIVGGTGVIGFNVEKNLKNSTRLSGKERFSTAIEILNGLSLSQEEIFFTDGYNYADALTGSVLAAKYNAPLLLVENKKIPSVISGKVKELEHFNLLGGNGAINESLVPSFQSLIN
ncbi:putative cell wall-binding protein [Metabacillus crassostreae]|uniref:cell wall-binding repeat-containing protein n=1 Tax=Metabacillus crassostreae TaxID=929098 RepID=UPI00195D1572|nr:cell wall-binding repeat-containing protein [Metabacillus crassostreae]MBM7606381.1 putative cell wall-binding protein [Metabacillus crassostreae]